VRTSSERGIWKTVINIMSKESLHWELLYVRGELIISRVDESNETMESSE